MMSIPNDVELSQLDKALSLAAQGFHVFPLIPNGRLPAISEWQNRATNDPDVVRRWWAYWDPVEKVQRVHDYNIGICTTRFGANGRLLVTDIDVKKNAGGRNTLGELTLLYDEDWLDTMRVATPSGGEHVYHTTEQPLATTTRRIGAGIDTRGEGGFVVAPGSVIDGRAYRLLTAFPVQPIPAWLAEMVGQPRQRKSDQKVVSILDTDLAMDRATAFLRDDAPLAVEGQGGDHLTFKVACRVKDLGVSELSCLDLMAEHWNERCSPAWPYEQLAVKVANAYSYGSSPAGVLDPRNDFDAIPDEPDQAYDVPIERAPPKRKLTSRRPSEINPTFDHFPLIDDTLDQGKLAVVYGDSNVGKTFVVMSMAYAIATGTVWHDRRTERGIVLFIAAEAGTSAEKRIAALKKRHGVEDFDVRLVTVPVSLLKASADPQAIVEHVQEIEALEGKVVLIIVDTLAAATAGANENSGEDMGPFIQNVQAINRGTGAAVLIVHHTGKDKARGARGWSGIRAAIDTEIEVGDGVISITKQRDIEKGQDIGFALESVVIGTRPDGKAVTSATVVLGVDKGLDFDGLELTPTQEMVMASLVEAIGEGEDASMDEWLRQFEKRNKGVNMATLRAHRNNLRKKLAVEEGEKGRWKPS